MAQVDDSWFPTPLYNQSQKQWTMYGFYLPSFMNPTQELSNPDSQYPRPFNFSIIQFGKTQIGNNNNTTTSTTVTQNGPLSSPTNQSNDMVHAFPIWAIIVLAITSATLFLLLMMTLLWFLYRRSPKDETKDTMNNNKLLAENEIATPSSTSPSPLPLSNEPPVAATLPNPRHSDASWQRRSSLLSSSNAAILGETVQKMIESPDWDDQEERRRRLGDQLLRKELEADQETMVKDTMATHKLQIKNSQKD
ncbi:unnamed protein product [Absidia cylindrospora]